MRTPLTLEGLLRVAGLALVTLGVFVACALLSLELRSVAPLWVPWALAALSFGLGVLLTRAVQVLRATRALPEPEAELAALIAVEAELAVLRLHREHRLQVDV